jgi:predicted short-subunit dehydrogenase-like oxidoreductase (DUF2520 family)
MKVVIIGSGNVAWHLLNRLQSTTHQVLQLVNLHSQHISPAFDQFNIPYCFSVSELHLEADIYLVAVKDDAIAHLHLPSLPHQPIVLHTSGMAAIEVLHQYSTNCGCLYPLQSFTKGIPVDFNEVPIIIETSNEMIQELTTIFAHSLSEKQYFLSLPQRRMLHLSAVLVNNFTNHLFVQAQKKLNQFDVSFDLLKPLLQETIHKLSSLPPNEAQTGPAQRNDVHTIALHESMLQDDEVLLHIYKTITAAILTEKQSNP